MTALCLLMLPTTIRAQDNELPELVNKGLAALNAGDWKEALKLHSEAVTRFGQNALERYGPRFGQIYYRKGIAHMRLGQHAEALEAFNICHREFPNAGETAGGGNNFHKLALLQAGNAHFAMGNNEDAIAQWQKFLEERDRSRDNYPQGTFHLNLAIAHYRIGKIPEGSEQFEIALRNKARFNTPDGGIIACFEELIKAALGSSNAQAALDFIGKNRGLLTLPPFLMGRFGPAFMKLAGQAIAAESPRLALELCQLVPATELVLEDLQTRITALGSLAGVRDTFGAIEKAKLEEQLATMRAELGGPNSLDSIRLAAVAFLHERLGNVRAAFAAYHQLEIHHSTSAKREENLYNLIRCASMVGQSAIAQEHALSFLELYPNSQYVPQVRKLVLSAVFSQGKYETVIEIASAMLPNLQKGSQEHDIALHVLGGSYFFTGQYDLANPLLEEHVKTYPESAFAQAAAYYQAANAAKLQFWSRAASLLDQYLSTYKDAPNQSFTPLALFDRATVHFAEDQLQEALAKIDRIISEFADSSVLELAHNLRGNVLETIGEDFAQAQAAYKEALAVSQARGNVAVAGEALSYLVALLAGPSGGETGLKEAVPYADLFWEKYAAGSPFRPNVAVAQVPALRAAGREEEALERLRTVISEMASAGDLANLEPAINSYTEIYLETHTPEQLREHYYNFPGISTNDRGALALLRIGLIRVFEQSAKNNDDPAAVRAANATIQVLFRDLRTQFDLKDLTNSILLQLGNYLQKSATPREALPFYEEILGRQDQTGRFAALLGRAEILASSADRGDRDRAIADLTRVFEDSQDRTERETPLYDIIRIHHANQEWDRAIAEANRYLERDPQKTLGFTRYTAQVGLLMAQSFEGRGATEDAIAMYNQVIGANQGFIAISAPAVLAQMKLTWQRNREGDRQVAYELGARYIKITRRLIEQNKVAEREPEAYATWQEVEKLAATYEANPDIKSLAQLEEERNSKRR